VVVLGAEERLNVGTCLLIARWGASSRPAPQLFIMTMPSPTRLRLENGYQRKCDVAPLTANDAHLPVFRVVTLRCGLCRITDCEVDPFTIARVHGTHMTSVTLHLVTTQPTDLFGLFLTVRLAPVLSDDHALRPYCTKEAVSEVKSTSAESESVPRIGTERKQTAAYSVMHHVGRTFLLLVEVIDVHAATNCLGRLNEAKAPTTSIILLGPYDEVPWELCGQFAYVKCAVSLEDALQLALEPWWDEAPNESNVRNV
jgi:hypothetical protein